MVSSSIIVLCALPGHNSSNNNNNEEDHLVFTQHPEMSRTQLEADLFLSDDEEVKTKPVTASSEDEARRERDRRVSEKKKRGHTPVLKTKRASPVPAHPASSDDEGSRERDRRVSENKKRKHSPVAKSRRVSPTPAHAASSDDDGPRERDRRVSEKKKRKNSPVTKTRRASPAPAHAASSDDEGPRQRDRRVSEKKKRKNSPMSKTRRASPARAHATASTSASTSKIKQTIRPVMLRKSTAQDLFGSESESEEQPPTPAVTGKKPSIVSYLTRRLANGHSRQVFDNKPGSHFIDLRVYKCDEIERVQPMNRWRQAIVCVKNRTDENTDAWQHLANFITATRKEYRNCPATFYSNYY